jgi:predicted nuclease of predicted toxin-antitoxin system
LLLRRPGLQLVRVQDIGLSGQDDPTLLAWASDNDRIILSHDQATLPDFAYERLAAGRPVAGVIIFPAKFPVASAIDEILAADELTEQEYWRERVVRPPLR